MRDEFVGDVGDFGKYILLKELRAIAGPEVKIGINWYYNTRPATAFRYLFDDKYWLCDLTLFAHLKGIHACRMPRLSVITDGGFLEGCLSYDVPIPYVATTPAQRKTDRGKWFDGSLEVLKDANMVFLDPDNGLPPYNKESISDNNIISAKAKKPREVTKSHVDAVKYAFPDEVRDYYNDKNHSKSVILYQHQNRKETKTFEDWFLKEINKIKPDGNQIIIRCPRYVPRYYALIAKTTEHHKLFTKLNKELMDNYPLLFEKV